MSTDTRPDPRSLHLAIALALLVLAFESPAAAQAPVLVRGDVRDRQSGAIPGAVVRLTRPLTGFDRSVVSGADGAFQIANVPPDVYQLRVECAGFAPSVRQLDLRTAVPAAIPVVLDFAVDAETITVTPDAPLVDAVTAGTRNQLSLEKIEQMPAAVGSRGLEAVLVSFPGFAQNANGAIHPRGAHNQMTYLIDGLPIGDQLTGAFANALDTGVVQTVELMTSNIPAEFGGKVSGVAVVTSRSGLSVDRAIAGDATVSVAGFGAVQGTVQAGGTAGSVGYFGSVSAMRTRRFLDQISLDNLHNAGAFQRGFFRVDILPTERDRFRFNAMGGHSSFDVANLRSQQAAGQDQQQTLADAAGWGSYLRTIGTKATLESTVGYRTTGARLDPSVGDTPVTAAQRRRLSTMTASARYSREDRWHQLRAGVEVQRFPVREWFSMGITSADFNEPGSPTFNRALLPHDLTRGGVPFVFEDGRVGRSVGAFVQSTVRWRAATVTVGLRHDAYSFLVDGHQLQPRVGVAWLLPGTAGVVRFSYNRMR